MALSATIQALLNAPRASRDCFEVSHSAITGQQACTCCKGTAVLGRARPELPGMTRLFLCSRIGLFSVIQSTRSLCGWERFSDVETGPSRPAEQRSSGMSVSASTTNGAVCGPSLTSCFIQQRAFGPWVSSNGNPCEFAESFFGTARLECVQLRTRALSSSVAAAIGVAVLVQWLHASMNECTYEFRARLLARQRADHNLRGVLVCEGPRKGAPRFCLRASSNALQVLGHCVDSAMRHLVHDVI